MKKIISKLLALVLSATMVLAITTISAYAKDDKSSKTDKKDSTSAPPITTSTAVPAAVTLDEAKEIALSHAGADSVSAVFTKEKLDKGVYELKFSDIYGKYEYQVAAVDGAILDYEWEIKHLRSAIPLESAKEIALNHAGVDGTHAEFTKEKLDETVYELKFSDENGKYKYEISAADGTILDYDWDIQTPAETAPGVPEDCSFQKGTVTREEASQTALDAAGVSRETLKYLVCYVSWENHVPTTYEVKFATHQATYHYIIGLNTGAILGSFYHPHH